MQLTALEAQIKEGTIDTVIVAAPDPFGRLVGKRFRGEVFLDSVAHHGTHGCNYLLTVNLDMDPLDGFGVTSWAAGFGDFAFRPDLGTLRLIPWLPATAMVLCDFVRSDGVRVAEAPRSVLRRQLEALHAEGWRCQCATELEFYLFQQTYREAWASAYRGLQPSSDYRIDYHISQPARDEPLMRAIRNQLTAAGVPIESSKGEWSKGQHEINFIHDEPLVTADRHVVFKHGVKELAEQHGRSVSFMAKYAPSEAGNSCHIHMSLWKQEHNAFAGPIQATPSPSGASRLDHGTDTFRHFLGGLMKYARELSLFWGPTINSYKRFQPGSWAPTRIAWSNDNRTCGFRVVGQGPSYRIENRMPGADANPYLALAAMLAAGRAGIAERLEGGPAYSGNAYIDTKLTQLPASLRDAADLLDGSAFARRSFGDSVVDFYVHHARLECQAFADAVTDWEKQRYFERI